VNAVAATDIALLTPLRRAEATGTGEPMRRLLGTCFVLGSVSAAVAADDRVRWRLYDNSDGVLLAIADADEGTDSFGAPLFHCRKATGQIVMEGEAKEAWRHAVADLIRADEPPHVQLLPSQPDNFAELNVFYSDMDAWRYRLDLPAENPLFDQLKRTGTFDFKLKQALVHEEFKMSLENVARFQEICKRTPKKAIN
jgi:hypothetical protein